MVNKSRFVLTIYLKCLLSILHSYVVFGISGFEANKRLDTNYIYFVLIHEDGRTTNVRVPVVFIPGDGASGIDAQLNITNPRKKGCPTYSDWYRIWLDVKAVALNKLECTAEHMRLEFDPATNTSRPPPGVRTRVRGFGTARGVEYIDDSWAAYVLDDVGVTARPLVAALVKHGYKRDVSIRGAPYDFRYGISAQKEYFTRLKKLIEETYMMNGDTRVAIISHSLGGILATAFLNRQSAQWKKTYIDSSITLAAPWGGSTAALLSLISGYTFHFKFISPLILRRVQRSYASTYLLLPHEALYETGAPFVTTDERNYTLARDDIVALLRRLGVSPAQYERVRAVDAVDIAAAPGDVMPRHPGVATFCLYGAGVATDHVLRYEGRRFPDQQPRRVAGDGDGTVGAASLSACSQWRGADSHHVRPLPGVGHVGHLQSERGIAEVLKVLLRR